MSSLSSLADKANGIIKLKKEYPIGINTITFLINDWDKGVDTLGFLSRCSASYNKGYSIRDIASMHYGILWTVTEENCKACDSVYSLFFGFVKMHDALCELEMDYGSDATVMCVSGDGKDKISVEIVGEVNVEFLEYIVRESPIISSIV